MPTTAGNPATWCLGGGDAAELLARLDRAAAGGDTVSTGDAPAPMRLGMVDPDARKVRFARRLIAGGTPWRGRSDVWFTPCGHVARGGKVAFLFPGIEPGFAEGGLDLPVLADRLGLASPVVTSSSVPHLAGSIYRLGLFLDRALRRLGVEPDVVAGHSIGEWCGNVAAGIIPPEHADDVMGDLDLDRVSLPDVEFVALGAGAAVVEPVIAGIDGVEVSHDNAPHQAVICGPPEAVGRAMARLRDISVLGYSLPFQTGFHTPAFAPMLDMIRRQMLDVPSRPAEVPMWSATTLEPYPDTSEEILELHLRHLVEPVRFRSLIERLYEDAGVRMFVQVGIGSLAGFVESTLGDRDHLAVPVLTAKRSALAQMSRALTALWVEGLDVGPAVPDTRAPAAPGPGLPASLARLDAAVAAVAAAGAAGALPDAAVAAADRMTAALRAMHRVGEALAAAPRAGAQPRDARR